MSKYKIKTLFWWLTQQNKPAFTTLALKWLCFAGGGISAKGFHAGLPAGLPGAGARQARAVPVGLTDCLGHDVPGEAAVCPPRPGCQEHPYQG